MDEWINVTDKLPGIGKLVRVLDKNKDEFGAEIIITNNNYMGWKIVTGGFIADSNWITHWKPIGKEGGE